MSRRRDDRAKPKACGILARISEFKDADELAEQVATDVPKVEVPAAPEARRSGGPTGVERQVEDCRGLAGELGWGIGEEYIEQDTGAFKRRRVVAPDGTTKMRVIRPEFRRMLADLESGVIDGLIAYDLDRIARDPRDLEDLIDVIELKKVPTDAVTGEVDLSTDNGIFMARLLVNVANKSSKDTRRRVMRKQQALAATGRPKGGGIRSFGYEADGVTVREEEAKLVRQIAKWILAGDSLNKISERLQTIGVPTVRGAARWSSRSVHSIVTKPRNAGLVVYHGEILRGVEAQWPAILDEDTWQRVQLVLATRAGSGDNELKRWLSCTLRCGICNAELTGSPDNYGGRYWCNPKRHGGCGKVAINQPRVEAYVEEMLLAYLSRPDVLAKLHAATSHKNTGKIRAELNDDEKQLEELSRLWGEKEISMKEYLAARGPILKRISEWEQLLTASLPLSVRKLTSGDVVKTWAKYRPAQRREVVRAVFPKGFIINRATKPGFAGFDPDRIFVVDWDGQHVPPTDDNLTASSQGRCPNGPTARGAPDGSETQAG